MHETHPIFRQPDDENTKVWRYMDFTKLVSLVDSRRLFFSRADRLGDPFEGSWPRINVQARSYIPESIPAEYRDKFAQSMDNMGELNKHWPRYNAVSCWHINEHESAAMWKLYLKSDEGIAVQSTYERLKASIIDEDKVYIGVVNYIDYENECIDAGNLLSPFVHKRKSFEHEREVRALVTKWPVGDGEMGMDFTKEIIQDGMRVRVDVERLIERIYIAPSAPRWFADLVRALIQRYGYSFEVVQSRLDDRPIF